MRKFILKAVVFFLFSILFYLLGVIVWGSYAPAIFKPNINYRVGSIGHLHSRLQEVKGQKDIDILFLGSSHAYRGFDTRIFSNHGFRTFNLGSSAQTPTQTNVLIDKYLDSLNPKMIIYEVYPTTLESDGVESSLDLIANDKNDMRSLQMALKTNHIKVYNTLLFGLTQDFFNVNESFVENAIKDKSKYISGGYVERELGFAEKLSFIAKKINVNPRQLNEFREVVSKIKNRNIDLILVYAPIPRARYESFSNNHYYDSLMSSYGEYYNFNEIISLDDSLHFFDNSHLNQNGVDVFNEKIIDEILLE